MSIDARRVRLTTITVAATFALLVLFGFVRTEASSADQGLNLTLGGNAVGWITSAPAGIDCGQNVSGHNTCSASFADGQAVTLTAHTDTDLQWSQDCSGTLLVCQLTMDQAKSVTATFSKLSPGISITTNDSGLGSFITAQSTVQGGLVPASGTLTFRAFAPGDTNCANGAAYTEIVTVTGQQGYSTGHYNMTQAGEYRWTVTYSGDPNNNGSATVCNAAGSISNVAKASTGVSNGATSATIGNPISNTANLVGNFAPTGTLTFSLYPAGDTSCSGPTVFTRIVSVNQAGTYGSGDYTPTQAGSYRWRISYSGDDNNKPASSNCGASNSISTVSKFASVLTTSGVDGTVGSPVHAETLLTQANSPTGTITFRAYGPNDNQCQGTPAFVSAPITVPSSGYQSGNFTPTQSGTYYWVASYSGDDRNDAASSTCSAQNSESVVDKASVSLVHNNMGDATVGSPIDEHDAVLEGGYNVSGKITFRAYGPDDADCSDDPVFTGQSVDIYGDGAYASSPFTPTQAGQYHWVAVYPGDANNLTAVAPCSSDASIVSKASPTISTQATNAAVGQSVSDTATITGGYALTGSVNFNLFAKSDTDCSHAPIFTSTIAVGDGTNINSGPFTPAEAGTYRWTAIYPGDPNNEAAYSDCNASGETSTIAAAEPTVSTTATDATIDSPVSAAATVAGGADPGGTITFSAYGSGDATCSGTPAFTVTLNVDGNGEYESGDFTPEASGTYLWQAEYSGDVNNLAADSGCGSSDSVVAKAAPQLALTASADIRLGSTVNAAADLTGGDEAAGTITFRLYGPGDETCSGSPAFEAALAVGTDGKAASPDFEPTVTGDYRWTAEYSGDANNAAVPADCASGKIVKVAPLTCPAVKAKAVKYRPRVIRTGPKTKGVRARISVSRPSHLEITARLQYKLKGKTHQAGLGKRSMRIGKTRGLRLPLPKKLRKKLPIGKKVKLLLRITATPNEPRGCTSPPQVETGTWVPVIQVLTAPQAP